MTLTVTQSTTRGIRIVACKGELARGHGEDELTAAVGTAVGDGARRFILDLTKLAWMDSAGVGTLVACSKLAADRGAVVRLAVAPEGAVRKILVATHLDRAFDVFDSVDEAAREFGV